MSGLNTTPLNLHVPRNDVERQAWRRRVRRFGVAFIEQNAHQPRTEVKAALEMLGIKEMLALAERPLGDGRREPIQRRYGVTSGRSV